MNAGLILSAGSSVRFGGGCPKQFCTLLDKETISYSIEVLKESPNVDAVIVSTSFEFLERIKNQYGIDVTVGGDSRNQSLSNGLEYIKRHYADCERVFINEAARPFITVDLVDDYLAKLEDYDAVITTQHITDSLGNYGKHTTDRSQYYLIQAPEAFRFDLLYKHFRAKSSLTATVQQLPCDSSIYYNFDFRHNLKITYPEDIVVAESLMRCIREKTCCP